MNKLALTIIFLYSIMTLNCHAKNIVPLYTLANIEKDFSKMADNGIDMMKNHTWEFLITGYSEDNMLKASSEFGKLGFMPVNMYTESDHSFYLLRLEVNKVYTPALLYKDTQTIENLVQQFKLRSFEKLNITK